MFTETRLVSGKKSDILVEGVFASVKHDIPFSISIISSQLRGTATAGLLFSFGAFSSTTASGTPYAPRVSTVAETLLEAVTPG